MQKSEKFFIFSWKELLVLILVAITAIGFFFTLGLHYGKKLGSEFKPAETHVATLEPGPEAAPPKDALEQGAHKAESEAGKAIEEATLKGLEENQMKVDHARPVDLPAQKVEAKSAGVKSAGAKSVEAAPKKEAEKTTEKVIEKAPESVADAEDAEESEASAQSEDVRKFGIQLGSYPSAKEAQKKVAVFGKRGLKTEVKTAVVGGQTRYRVVLPGFKSRKTAEAKGKELRASRKVESFVVIKL
jgi:cell division protein FtsN